MRRYSVDASKKQSLLRFTSDALEASGARVLEEPAPDVAPFVYKILTRQGEALTLICYAFLANKYGQRNRPEDEHRFQIKYGSDFRGYHEIYMPAAESEVTLLFGVHLSAGIFVACDPATYNPTWFSRSVYLKTRHVEAAQGSGWFGWESPRRVTDKPLASFSTETVVAFTPEHFGRYISLERAATGSDPGVRLQIADRLSSGQPPHRLFEELELSPLQLADLIVGNRRFLVAARGHAAEHHLGRHIARSHNVTSFERIDEDGRPDFRVRIKGNEVLRIECKNVLRELVRGLPKVDFQKTRASLGDPCSRYYRSDQFEVLAACLHPQTSRWEYRFWPTSDLRVHRRCADHLDNNVFVDEVWPSSLDQLVENRLR